MVPITPPTDGPTVTPQTGIFNDNTMPGHFDFFAQNAYSGPAGRHWYTVYVGCKFDSQAPDYLGDGGVFVFQDDGATVNLGPFIAPGHLSCLKAVSYSGVMLRLRSNTGQTITFDVLTRTYIQ